MYAFLTTFSFEFKLIKVMRVSPIARIIIIKSFLAYFNIEI